MAGLRAIGSAAAGTVALDGTGSLTGACAGSMQARRQRHTANHLSTRPPIAVPPTPRFPAVPRHSLSLHTSLRLPRRAGQYWTGDAVVFKFTNNKWAPLGPPTKRPCYEVKLALDAADSPYLVGRAGQSRVLAADATAVQSRIL